VAHPLLDADDWPLEVVVAVTDDRWQVGLVDRRHESHHEQLALLPGLGRERGRPIWIGRGGRLPQRTLKLLAEVAEPAH
jgi:hypothetical protein